MEEKKVLIVDDEDSIREVFELALKHKGYTVFSADSGEKALELLKHETIPVMFLDINLPGINGIELCRKIIKKTPNTIAYAVTGYASTYKSSDCKAAGFDDYFAKPLPLKTLFSAAQHAFEKQSGHTV